MSDLENKLFDQTWNYKNRKNIISQLKERVYDIIVIGGGITGAGVAREAAMRGLNVSVIENPVFLKLRLYFQFCKFLKTR